MMGYGTGAIMAVPAHDERDYAFAKKFGIDIIPVIRGGDVEERSLCGRRGMINSDFLNGLDNKADSIARMIDWLTTHGIGEGGVQYKMKDWAFNRQRYWGSRFPSCTARSAAWCRYPTISSARLPPMTEFEPGQGGESPLAKGGFLRALHLPEVRRRRPPGNGYHAPVGWLVLVLPPVYRSAQ